MGSTITVRGLPTEDKSWLQLRARELGCSMEALVRRIIREQREQTQRSVVPSEVARRHFGPTHGVDLALHRGYGCGTVAFSLGENEWRFAP